MPDQIEVLTAEETAEILKVNIDTVRRLLRRGDLPGVKVGRHWRVEREVLRQYLRGRRIGGWFEEGVSGRRHAGDRKSGGVEE